MERPGNSKSLRDEIHLSSTGFSVLVSWLSHSRIINLVSSKILIGFAKRIMYPLHKIFYIRGFPQPGWFGWISRPDKSILSRFQINLQNSKSFQSLWCWWPAIRETKMDPLLWQRERFDIHCSHLRVWSTLEGGQQNGFIIYSLKEGTFVLEPITRSPWVVWQCGE